jgi:NADPH:quinone reductase-like Zn-dependent oxidoreductase
MKAIVLTKYGLPDIFPLTEIEKPEPSDNEVLVKIFASSVNYNILVYILGKPLLSRLMGVGLFKPACRIPGGDIAEKVETVGKNITQFHPGDDVFGELDGSGYGAYAEYVCAPEKALALKPANLTFGEAAVLPQASLVALQALQKVGKIQPGHKVLIYGASGGIGTFAVQIAKSFGAEVTGVCSTRNLDMVSSLGADHVIDYTKEDFTKKGQLYDLIVATAGYRSIFDFNRALRPGGIHVATGGTMNGPHALSQIFQPMLLGPMIALFSRLSGKYSRKKLTALSLTLD